jgi:hypothetical protein
MSHDGQRLTAGVDGERSADTGHVLIRNLGPKA